MDLVYKLSKHSIALLEARIHSDKELGLLADLLEGKFVDDRWKGHQSVKIIKRATARAVFELLNRLISDEWWTRAWTFQEDYYASKKMNLLIRHDHHTSATKKIDRMARLFGSLNGELCIESTTFRRETNWFCLAFKKICNQQQQQICDQILGRAGKYTVSLRNTSMVSGDSIYRPMSATVFADIGIRNARYIEDRLAIAANCCSYRVRRNTDYLRKISLLERRLSGVIPSERRNLAGR